jgi:hypothetical protein
LLTFINVEVGYQFDARVAAGALAVVSIPIGPVAAAGAVHRVFGGAFDLPRFNWDFDAVLRVGAIRAWYPAATWILFG